MEKAEISKEAFTALVDRAGLTLTEKQAAELREAYGYLRAMTERIRTPRGRETEPAHLFVFPPSTLQSNR